MAKILPFQGIYYYQQKISNISSVIAQPYDIITPEMINNYYRCSEYNIVHITKGKDLPGDSVQNNKYTRARDYFENWFSKGVLVQDSESSIYVYEQIYHINNSETRSRLGFIALGELEDYDKKIVLPHERTHAGPKEDRLKLMQATNANWEQIFMLYADPENKINTMLQVTIKEKLPLFNFKSEDNITHKLWRISDRDIIDNVRQEMVYKSIVIADGHHRYETALKFRADNSALPTAKYRMMTFVNMDDKGLSVFPTHRLIRRVPGLSTSLLKEKLENEFSLKEFPSDDKGSFFSYIKEQSTNHHLFGLYDGNTKFYALTLRDRHSVDKYMCDDRSTHWKNLDVAVFDSIIISGVLGIDKNVEQYIAYSKDNDETIELVKNGEFQWAFFLNPTKIEQIKAVTLEGERMPQKSTYFYPKLITGLVFYKL